MRKIFEAKAGRHAATVFYSHAHNEYRVRFFRDGEPQPKADYFADDKEDAIGTAKAEILRLALIEAAPPISPTVH